MPRLAKQNFLKPPARRQKRKHRQHVDKADGVAANISHKRLDRDKPLARRCQSGEGFLTSVNVGSLQRRSALGPKEPLVDVTPEILGALDEAHVG